MSRRSAAALLFALAGAGVISACSESEGCAERGECLSEGAAEGGTAGEGGDAGGPSAGSGASSAGKGSGGSAGERGDSAGSAGELGGAAAEGGSAGDPGSREAGGEGGSRQTECRRDLDCSDGWFCNGVERCEDGACVAASPPCDDVVADGCDVTCDESTEACVATAPDHDGDGVSSAACSMAPGDDCDDEDDSVRPGATEICDGVDNDCDGLVDLSDGLALTGTTRMQDLVHHLDLAWLPELGSFGMALARYNEVFFAPLGTDGAPGEERLIFPEVPLSSPRIVWGGDRFAMLSREENGMNKLVEFINDAQPISSFEQAGALYVDDIARSDEDWVFVATVLGVGLAARLDHVTNTVSATEPLSGARITAMNPRLAFDSTRLAAAWRETPGTLKWSPLSKSLKSTNTQTLSTTAFGGLGIAVTPQGYAFAWNVEEGIAFQRSASDGLPECEPTIVNFGNVLFPGMSVALAHSPIGTLVLAPDVEQRVLGLFRFDADCRLVDQTVVAEGQRIGAPSIAIGENAVALGWTADTGATGETAFQRVVGGALCE